MLLRARRCRRTSGSSGRDRRCGRASVPTGSRRRRGGTRRTPVAGPRGPRWRRSVQPISSRPMRPLPSANGWIVSNWAWRRAAAVTGSCAGAVRVGDEVDHQDASMRSSGVATYAARCGVGPPTQPMRSRQAPLRSSSRSPTSSGRGATPRDLHVVSGPSWAKTASRARRLSATSAAGPATDGSTSATATSVRGALIASMLLEATPSARKSNRASDFEAGIVPGRRRAQGPLGASRIDKRGRAGSPTPRRGAGTNPSTRRPSHSSLTTSCGIGSLLNPGGLEMITRRSFQNSAPIRALEPAGTCDGLS